MEWKAISHAEQVSEIPDVDDTSVIPAPHWRLTQKYVNVPEGGRAEEESLGPPGVVGWIKVE